MYFLNITIIWVFITFSVQLFHLHLTSFTTNVLEIVFVNIFYMLLL